MQLLKKVNFCLKYCYFLPIQLKISLIILINEMIEIMELKLRLYKSWGTKVLN